MKENTSILTRSAVFLAIALIVQSIRLVIPGIPTLIIGTLVNMLLIMATYYCGLWSGIIISVVTPLMAMITGQLPNVLFIPCVAIANAVYVVLFFALKNRMVYKGLYQKASGWAGMIIGAVAKFAVIYLLMVQVAIPMVIREERAAAVLSGAFSIPQLLTALAGGVLAMILIKLIPSKIEE